MKRRLCCQKWRSWSRSRSEFVHQKRPPPVCRRSGTIMALNADTHVTHRQRTLDTSEGMNKPYQQQTQTSLGVQSILSALQTHRKRHLAPGDPPRPPKPLPGTSDETRILDRGDASDGATVLRPRRLEIRKKLNPAQEIYELKQENGYLRTEVALLKDTRCALRELQSKTHKAFLILQTALMEVSDSLSASEQRLLSYWGAHSEDGNEEIKAF